MSIKKISVYRKIRKGGAIVACLAAATLFATLVYTFVTVIKSTNAKQKLDNRNSEQIAESKYARILEANEKFENKLISESDWEKELKNIEQTGSSYYYLNDATQDIRAEYTAIQEYEDKTTKNVLWGAAGSVLGAVGGAAVNTFGKKKENKERAKEDKQHTL